MTIIEKRRTLVFRLTLIFAFMFFVASTMVFGVSRLLISYYLIDRADKTLSSYWSQLSLEIEMNIVPSVAAELAEKAMSRGKEQVFYQVLTGQGQELASSDMSGWPSVAVDRESLDRARKGEQVFRTVDIQDMRKRLRIMYAPFQGGNVFVAGLALAEQDTLLNQLTQIFVGMVILVMLIGLPIGWQAARKAMAGVEEVADVAGIIAQGQFDRRVSVSGKSEEIERLAGSFNTMLEHIQGFIRQMREINDNIAHDLRTPVTRIRGMAETTLLTDSSAEEFRGMAADIIEECDRLLGIVNTVLEISETEAGLMALNIRPVDLVALSAKGVSLFRALAEEKDISLDLEAGSACHVDVDEAKFQRIMSNLLDNAIKFTPRGGAIRVCVHHNGHAAFLAVEDNGAGISEKDLPDVFNRFFRADRSRTAAGYGLGLSLARSIARAHGGDITVSSRPGKGSTFTVFIPMPCRSAPERSSYITNS